MKKKNVRTIITMMTMMVSACIIFASCGKVEETHNQVANTTEKAAAGATVESKEEIITKETTATATTPTTTTTTASTTEEPKTIAETTTEGVTIIVPDTDTETADTTVETNTDTEATEATEAVTTTVEPETTTEATTAKADDGMYTMEECIRRVIRDNLGQEVVSFEESNKYVGVKYVAVLEDGQQVGVFSKKDSISIYATELVSIDNYYWNDMTDDPIYDDICYVVIYNEKK